MQVNTVELYRSLTELARRYQFRNRDEICCYGLTVSQCYALQTLQEGAHSTSALSDKLGLDISSTTRLVDQLVRKKLVYRTRGNEDGRVRQIEHDRSRQETDGPNRKGFFNNSCRGDKRFP